jgi:hypothetical protein
MLNHPSPHRIEHNVAAHFKQVRLPIDQDRFIASLKQVPYALVSPVRCLCVDPVIVRLIDKRI